MTTDPIEQLMTGIRDIRLTEGERSSMRRALIAMIHTHPSRSPMVSFIARHAMAYTFGALVLLTGSTAALADRSSPGDFLYSVKTSVNDQVAVAVAGDEDRRIQKELDLIDRALNEEDAVGDDNLNLDEDEPTSVEFNDDGVESDLDVIERLLREDDGSASLETSL